MPPLLQIHRCWLHTCAAAAVDRLFAAADVLQVAAVAPLAVLLLAGQQAAPVHV
jgi:hypothetical protein